MVGTCLTLPNLGFLWVFFKYPKISKNGNPLFFPVYIVGKKRARGARWEGKREKSERRLLFFLFPSSPARFLFFSIIAQREPLQRREVQTDNCQSEMVIEQLVDHRWTETQGAVSRFEKRGDKTDCPCPWLSSSEDAC